MLTKSMVENLNESFCDSFYYNNNSCRLCGQKDIEDWHKTTKVERVFTQSTSLGGNEATYDITYDITSCPHCGYEYIIKENNRTFICHGWINFVEK